MVDRILEQKKGIQKKQNLSKLSTLVDNKMSLFINCDKCTMLMQKLITGVVGCGVDENSLCCLLHDSVNLKLFYHKKPV